MPYFRYFGPTAIVPGLRQMVVKVRGKQHGSAQTTSDRTYCPYITILGNGTACKMQPGRFGVFCENHGFPEWLCGLQSTFPPGRRAS
jgi:hypothetical protein